MRELSIHNLKYFELDFIPMLLMQSNIRVSQQCKSLVVTWEIPLGHILDNLIGSTTIN